MAFRILVGLLVVVVALLVQCGTAVSEVTCSGAVPMRWRREVLSITDFGAVGDGRTLNTWPFMKAIYRIQHRRRRGGTLLYIPPGVWLTGSFNLTSHMTLYLARGAVIKATKDTWNWPLMDPLPSYGRGRELPGGRYASLIHGNGIRDVIITGKHQLYRFCYVANLLRFFRWFWQWHVFVSIAPLRMREKSIRSSLKITHGI